MKKNEKIAFIQESQTIALNKVSAFYDKYAFIFSWASFVTGHFDGSHLVVSLWKEKPIFNHGYWYTLDEKGRCKPPILSFSLSFGARARLVDWSNVIIEVRLKPC